MFPPHDATMYSAACVIRLKKKDMIVKKIFHGWIESFSHPKRILVDNMGNLLLTL